MKLKARIKNNQLVIKIKLASDEIVSGEVLELFSTRNVRGFLRPFLAKKKVLQYSGPSGISLEQYLQLPMTEHDFYSLMAQVTESIRKIQNQGLLTGNLLLDVKYVYINEVTRELLFSYLPLVSEGAYGDIPGFMENVAFLVRKTYGRDMDFLTGFVFFLRSLGSCPEIQRIENYLASADREVALQIRRQARQNTWTGTGQSGFMNPYTAAMQGGFASQYEAPGRAEGHDEADTSLLEEPSTTLLMEEGQDTSLLEEPSTTLLLEEEQGTVPLEGSMDEVQRVHYPTLCRSSTGETISINKPVFRIGKEKSYVDYFIPDNQAISRSHADIIVRGDGCFVCDRNATNHTYINSKLLAVQVETPIEDGDILRLANEEFVFYR